MAHGPARIDTPEVIRGFRARFTAFDQTCRTALMGIGSEVSAAREWLRNEQRTRWSLELRKRQEELVRAVGAYQDAKHTASLRGISSAVDERRALDRARRRKEEAEEKLEAVRKWTMLVDQKVAKLLGPCHALSTMMEQTTPRALARLDRMLESLTDYFGDAPKEAP